jgi:hypothetical protein
MLHGKKSQFAFERAHGPVAANALDLVKGPFERIFNLDQRFANNTLADSKLLGKLPFDNLFSGPHFP